MPKDRLFLALLLMSFALMGFGCDEPAENPGDGPMPDRAGAANPLLRHYFDTNTFPDKMAAWKIPEGDEFEDETLEMNFSMGGGEVITDVRVRVFIVPPGSASESAPDVRLRVRAPDGTTSRWEEVSFVTGNGGEGLVDLNAEIVFANEFDGIVSTGSWRVELRDPVEDEDGRCLLRNATLRLNGGLPAGSATGNETLVDPLDVGQYDRRLPEVTAPRTTGDFGYVGTDKPVKLIFTATNSFAVRRMRFTFTLRLFGDASTDNVNVCITSPSGGWLLFELSDDSAFASAPGTTGDVYTTFSFDLDSAAPDLGNGFFFSGEPSAGTWRIYLWDDTKDGNGIFLAPQTVDMAGVIQAPTAAEMILS